MTSPAVQPLLALLASHVGGNPTQYMFERAFAHHGLDWRYLTFEIGPEDLGDAVRGLRALGFRGGHCGDPHRQAVLALLDRTTETAAMLATANLIFRDDNTLVGDNTEGRGVLNAVRDRLDPAGKQIVLFGAGQIARAVAAELAGAAPASLTIVNRTESRADELVAMLAAKFDVPLSSVAWQDAFVVPPEVDVLVNATSVGQSAEDPPLPLALDSLRPELLVVDVVAGATPTRLIGEAARCGCETLDGLAILIEQAAVDMQIWTGVDPSRQVLREAAEEFLGL